MRINEILNEFCAVLERKHGLYVSPVRYNELLKVMKNLREDTDFKNRREKLYLK